jgi:hypothetical protein
LIYRPAYDLKSLDAIGDCRHLTRLEFEWVTFNDRCEWLKHLPKLKRFLLNRSDEVDHIVPYLRSPNLEEFLADSTDLKDAHLPRIASLPSLRTCIISTTGITDRGLEYFRGHPQLETLFIDRTAITDESISIVESLKHGGIANDAEVEIKWINSEALNEKNIEKELGDVDGLLVPGGFGDRGIEGKIVAIKYAREHNMPFFGICLGMQLAVVEFARNQLGFENANSTEINPDTKYPVIDIMLEQKEIQVVTFTSSSTVQNFVEMLKAADLVELLRGSTVACIGPVTADTAKSLGLKVDVVAGEYTIEGLVNSILHYYGLSDLQIRNL